MKDIRKTTNTANRVVQENRVFMAPFRENMRGGRSVKEQDIHSQPYSQMMVASNAYLRIAIDQKVTIESSKTTTFIQTKQNTDDPHFMSMNKIIIQVAYEIENNNFHKDNALSPCLFVTKKN